MLREIKDGEIGMMAGYPEKCLSSLRAQKDSNRKDFKDGGNSWKESLGVLTFGLSNCQITWCVGVLGIQWTLCVVL